MFEASVEMKPPRTMLAPVPSSSHGPLSHHSIHSTHNTTELTMDYITQMLDDEQKNVTLEEDATVADLRKKVQEAWDIDGFQMKVGAVVLDKEDQRLSDSSIEGGEVIKVSVCPKKAAEMRLKAMGVTTALKLRLLEYTRKGAAKVADGALVDEEMFQKFELCISAGHDVMTRDGVGNPLLSIAAMAGCVDTVNYLLKHGADVNAVVDNKTQNTALLAAARKGNTEVCKVLLDAGATLEAVDEYKQTPLHVSAITGRHETVQLLIERKAEVDAKDDAYETPLILACKRGHVETVRALVAGNANVQYESEEKDDQPTRTSTSAIRTVARSQKPELIAVLCDAGADINCVDKMQKAPLWWAASTGNVDMVNAILSRPGRNIEVVDKEGYTPLMIATMNLRKDAVIALVNAGASLTAKSTAGKTAIDIATQQTKEGPNEILAALKAGPQS